MPAYLIIISLITVSACSTEIQGGGGGGGVMFANRTSIANDNLPRHLKQWTTGGQGSPVVGLVFIHILN